MDRRFKALITDFDGTLVGLDFTPSPKITKAIAKSIENGYRVSIATGRPFEGMIKKVCRQLHLQAPQIVKGGAEIIDPKTDQILWVEYFPLKDAKRIIKFFTDGAYHFSVESDEHIFTVNGEVIKEYGPDILFRDLRRLDYNKVAKIVLINNFPNITLEEMIENLRKFYPNLHTTIAGLETRPVLDITSKKATKHLAILRLSEILGINPGFMIGVGNGYNDYPLLSACGFKVAMENAPKELKEIADMIVPKVEEDGLLKVIDRLFS